MSLIGLLNHAATVVRPGRAFLRSLIDASSTTANLDHWVHLNAVARADIAWWHTFLQRWNGISLLPPATPSVSIISDVSGSWGCCALCLNQWFQLAWPPGWEDVLIVPKELVPILVAMAMWGGQWSGSRVLCQSATTWLQSVLLLKGRTEIPSLCDLFAYCPFSALPTTSYSLRATFRVSKMAQPMPCHKITYNCSLL